jgi:diketogulonate reductase-like aldo/keto reductase
MMVGVVEAMAYTMRIYGHLLLSSRDITSEAREHYHRNLNAMLDTTILRRWDADLLMRKLPYYLHLLDEMLGMLYDSVGIESSDSSQTDAVPIDLCALFAERIGSNEAPIAPGAGTHTLSGTHSGNDNKQSESTAAYIDLPGLMDSLLPSSVAVDASGGSASVPDVGSVDTSMTLNNGATFPAIGLGTWQLDGQKCTDAVLAALQIGYRHIDSAEAYRNERAVGDAITQALRTGLVKDRDELFIATKLSSPNSAGGYGKTRNTVMRQLADLQVDYIDLYMLHSPLEHVLQDETWSELEQLYNEGLIRALGVSNFDVRELNHLLSKAKVPPAVVQNKFDIYHQGKQFDATGMNMLRFCKERGIVLVAYSSFSAYPFVMQPLDDPIVLEIASRLRMTPSELLMFYNTQLGVASIPRSTDVDHLKENFLHKYRSSDTSDHRLSIRLSDGDMRRLSGIQHLVTTPVTLVGL